MSTVQTQYTPDDLLAMPDGDRFELVDGHLVERAMGAESSWVAGRIFGRVERHLDIAAGGWLFPEGTSYQCFPDDPQKVRRPDTSFVQFGRFDDERIPTGHIRLAPDLAAEVVSPNDSYYEVEQKVEEFLAAGTRLVWVVNPDNRTVKVYRGGGGDPSHLSEDEELAGEDVLPCFRCVVRELFPPRLAD